MDLTRQVLQELVEKKSIKKRRSCASSAASGVQMMQRIKRAEAWPDGERLGSGHGSPWLQPKYADQIESLQKTIEGRPRDGWAADVKVNDWINFGVSKSGGRRLVCRVTSVNYLRLRPLAWQERWGRRLRGRARCSQSTANARRPEGTRHASKFDSRA